MPLAEFRRAVFFVEEATGMLILLPPSETKRSGGSAGPIALDALALPALTHTRRIVMTALAELSSDEDLAARTLKLSERQRGEVAINAALWSAPIMPAMDRYTGVLFDALGAETLDDDARRWLSCNVMIHSAPFGPIGAGDEIPSYRMGAGVRLPGLASTKAVWAGPVTNALAIAPPDFVLDLRSEAYVALGPIPTDVPSVFLRTVTESADGTTRALNHFNKHAKGELVRALASSNAAINSAADLLAWAGSNDWRIQPSDGEFTLII